MIAFLGVKITRNDKTQMVTLMQPRLIQCILEATNMDCHAEEAHHPYTLTLLESDNDSQQHSKEPWHLVSVVGMLLYLASSTHPSLAFAINQAAQYMHCP